MTQIPLVKVSHNFYKLNMDSFDKTDVLARVDPDVSARSDTGEGGIRNTPQYSSGPGGPSQEKFQKEDGQSKFSRDTFLLM